MGNLKSKPKIPAHEFFSVFNADELYTFTRHLTIIKKNMSADTDSMKYVKNIQSTYKPAHQSHWPVFFNAPFYNLHPIDRAITESTIIHCVSDILIFMKETHHPREYDVTVYYTSLLK